MAFIGSELVTPLLVLLIGWCSMLNALNTSLEVSIPIVHTQTYPKRHDMSNHSIRRDFCNS